jgi:hypothetical protein
MGNLMPGCQELSDGVSISSTLAKDPRRTLWVVNSANQGSTSLSPRERVGTKWGRKRGGRWRQAGTRGCLGVP